MDNFDRFHRLRRVGYEVTAAFLGIAWYAVVSSLFPLTSNQTENSWGLADVFVLGCFPLTSTIVSIAFRRWIREARGLRLVLVGTVLVYVGALGCALLFGFGCLLAPFGRFAIDALSGFAAEYPWDEVSFLLYGSTFAALFVATKLFYITIPMGIGSVALLRWMDRFASARRPFRARHNATATSTRAL